jgi:hypothetical protein
MSSDFGINVHPDAGDIRTEKFSGFHTLVIGPTDHTTHRLAIFIGPSDRRAVLDALTAALDVVRADMNAAEQDARDQVPSEMADWPAGPPGELVGIFGK